MFARLPPLLSRLLVKLERLVDHFSFYPLLALFAALDSFLLIVPTDGLVVSSTLLRPKRWMTISFIAAIGSALGVLCLAALIRWKSDELIATFFEDALTSTSWSRTETFIDQYGTGALALIALSPFPQLPAVILTAMSHMSLTNIALSVFAGRVVKFAFFAWAATHAPRLLGKITGLKRELKQFEIAESSETATRTEQEYP